MIHSECVKHNFTYILFNWFSNNCYVLDQSICGSCWSFGTTGTIEGAYFLKHGERKSFSEQVCIFTLNLS